MIGQIEPGDMAPAFSGGTSLSKRWERREQCGSADAWFQALLDQSPTPERCIEAFHLQRTRFEMVAERKLLRRQLTEDGNVEITGRDLREKTPSVGQGTLFAETAA